MGKKETMFDRLNSRHPSTHTPHTPRRKHNKENTGTDTYLGSPPTTARTAVDTGRTGALRLEIDVHAKHLVAILRHFQVVLGNVDALVHKLRK